MPSENDIMTGIVLSADQIRTAPADVRRWIEREVSTSLGLSPPTPDAGTHNDHLVACSTEQLAGVLAGIQGILPVVNVFFEFGRQGAVIGSQGLEAFRLTDIMHHTRLQSVGQVITCLDAINQALREVSDETNISFCAIDREGHCFVPMQTQQNILRLWHEIIASQQMQQREQSDMPRVAMPGARPLAGEPENSVPGPGAVVAPDEAGHPSPTSNY
jgi:hypothetical protein